MPGSFKVGDQVSWNSEAGYVSGVIIAVRTVSFDYKVHTHRASPEALQYQERQDRSRRRS